MYADWTLTRRKELQEREWSLRGRSLFCFRDRPCLVEASNIRKRRIEKESIVAEQNNQKEMMTEKTITHLSMSAKREYVMKALYMSEYHEVEEREEQVLRFLEFACIDHELAAALCDKYSRVTARTGELDQMLMTCAQGWDLNRIGRVELAILRLAIYEICFDESVPEAVAINEAVVLAKKFGGEHSGSFVNGILSKVVKQYGTKNL